MYVHLGGEIVAAVTEIVAVLDARLLAGEINREFVERAAAGKRLRGARTPECKALVVTRDGVIATVISAPTLARRIRHLRQSAEAWERETLR